MRNLTQTLKALSLATLATLVFGPVVQASDKPDYTQWVYVPTRQPAVVVVDLYENEFVVTVDGIPTTYLFEVNPVGIEVFAVGIAAGGMGVDVTYQGYSTKVDCFEFRGGDGNDVVDNTSTLGLYARGNGGDDVLDGSSSEDYLEGGDGNDVIRGRGGNDYLDGGNGNDELRGQGGFDYMVGGNGADELIGGDGADFLISCTLSSTDGALDTLTGNAGADIFYAEAYVLFPIWVPALNKVVWRPFVIETDVITDLQGIDTSTSYEVPL